MILCTCLFKGEHQILGAVLGVLVALVAAAVLVVLAVLGLQWWKKGRKFKEMKMDVIAM